MVVHSQLYINFKLTLLLTISHHNPLYSRTLSVPLSHPSRKIPHKFPKLTTLGRTVRVMRDRSGTKHPNHRAENEWRVARARGRCKSRVPQITPTRWGSVDMATRAVAHLLICSSTPSYSRYVKSVRRIHELLLSLHSCV